MNIYNLPQSTIVNRNVPKNAFDEYSNSKQKRMFTDLISKITWKHKISSETINLSGIEVQEIQLFEIQLKEKNSIRPLLDIIDKAIPYHIIFIIVFENEVRFRTAKKHLNPLNENNAVIDWVFETEWANQGDSAYGLELKKNIDSVYYNFCSEITGEDKKFDSIAEMISYQSEIKELETNIERLKSLIKNAKQFNRKLELNVELNRVEGELEGVMGRTR
ncbi:DUF4391 domain-containing protein [Aequorivita capsosiphonis]|uniref:DUF4391 domain-containing protein n=1 Tax=Aequorivita capsosiphonis TaxID=487317 RepID=UPI0004287EFB|nr:DUF4391 domain-containing protein [Aequorivita capsosiphonis]